MPVEQRGVETAENTALTFEGFFRGHYSRLAQALLLLTGDRGEAEELAQETMARVYERWDRIRTMESPQGYAYRTALNLNRKRLRRLRLGTRHAPEPFPISDPAALAADRADVHRALAGLSRQQREALILTEWLGLDAAEAGLVLGLAPSSVRVRLHRARAALRRELGGPDG